MSVKEKLVELLINSPGLDALFGDWERDADFLIANGVTIKMFPTQMSGEWTSVKDGFPEKSGKYLIYQDGIFMVLDYSAKHKLFNTHDHFDEKHCEKYSIEVTHWSPLPEAPKGE